MVIRVDGWWKPKEEGDFARPIHFSTHNHHLIKFKLEKFQNPNILDGFGRTPLIIACLIKARKRELKALLDAGADINCLWESKCPYRLLSPLTISILYHKFDLAHFLLKHGADPNLRIFNGFTALHLAVVFRQMDLIGWLIDAKADTNAKDDYGYTPLHLAALFSKEICKVLLDVEDTKVNICGHEGETPLHIAAFKGNYENVKVFVERQANINCEMRDHRTAIDCTTSPTIMKYLMFRNAECKGCFEQKPDWIPFNCYVPYPLIKLLKAMSPLVSSPENEVFNKFKCDLNTCKLPDTTGRIGRPMDPRCRRVHLDPSWYFIDPVTVFPNFGIHHVLNHVPSKPIRKRARTYEFAKKRLEDGQILDKKEHFPCFMQLIGNWGSFMATNRTLKFGGYCLSVLMDVGLDVNEKNAQGYTPLFLLIEDGFECAAVFLLNAGADPNLRVNDVTPLMMASVRGLKKVVLALLEKGADVNAVDKRGISALQMASYFALFNPPEVVQALIAKGADVNAVGPSRVTALHLSAVSMSPDRCHYLLNAGAFIDARVFELTAVDLAFLFMNIPAAAILKLSGDMFKSAKRGDLGDLEKYLRRGAIVNCQRANQGTVLMSMTDIPFTLYAILILKYEPDYLIKDRKGLTAFHHAVINKNYLTLVMFLKKWGIDLLFENGDNHIDNLIKICEESKRMDWMMEDETKQVLVDWKTVYEKGGKKMLEQLINAHFYDYIGFATLIFKFGWRKALKFFRQSGTSLY
ncbi:hypothetical protein GE061_010531 [Apolygus lucorum]|uniref:Uncharacterized protein n=1 Tax=Apolygus lucorum TaxID=248454 RepID=A0A6A4K996_APOLU|nr:hypothetical protein GE061_010531 [Apolygus lucorum]